MINIYSHTSGPIPTANSFKLKTADRHRPDGSRKYRYSLIAIITLPATCP